jgi:hypothetical protein
MTRPRRRGDHPAWGAGQQIAVSGIFSGAFDQIRVVGCVAAHEGNIPSHLFFLAEHQPGFRVITFALSRRNMASLFETVHALEDCH